MRFYLFRALKLFVIFLMLYVAMYVISANLFAATLNDMKRIDKSTPRVISTTYENRVFPQNFSQDIGSLKFVSGNQTENCTRQNNVMFLKTHKTASSAMQNILFRYGSHHNLTFALPKNKRHFSYPKLFQSTSVQNPKGMKNFNILCHHMRFNHEKVKKVMPDNTFYVSILREPGTLFESTFDYFWEFVPAFKHVDRRESPEKWLDNAEEYFRSSTRNSQWHFAKNSLIYDFGYDNLNEDTSYVENAIQEVTKRFDLILIADHFEESMVLLSDALCWPLDEVASLSLNARSQLGTDLASRSRISEKARRWNRADAALFDHFNATLWQKIKSYGIDRMQKKVEELENIKRNLTELCIEGGKAVDSSKMKDPSMLKKFWKPKDVAMKGYNLRKEAQQNSLCRELVMPENAFGYMLFERQHKT